MSTPASPVNPGSLANSGSSATPANPQPVDIDAANTKQQNLFSTKTVYDLQLPDPDSDSGFKSISVRFPTDAEWCKRQRSILSIQRSLGRDASRSESKGEEEANLELVNAILLAPAGTTGKETIVDALTDPYDAAVIIGKLLTRQVTEVEKRGNRYIISMQVVGGIHVSHTLKILSARQMAEYGNAAVKSINRRGTLETRVLLEPTADIWAKTCCGVEGYAGVNDPDRSLTNLPTPNLLTPNIPIVHKDTVVTELLMQLRQEMDGGPDPED